MRFLCPNCHRELEVPDEAAGTAGSCRLCGAAIIAPSGPEQPALLAHAPGAPPPPSGVAPGPQAPYGRLQPFNILSEAWSIVWGNFGPIAISTYLAFIVVAIAFVIVLGPSLIGATQDAVATASGTATAVRLPWYLNLASLAIYVALAPLLAGPLYVIDDLLTQGAAEISATFRGFRQYRDLALFMLAYQTPTTVFGLLDSAAPLTAPGEARLWAVVSGVVSMGMAVFFLPGLMEIVDRGADAATALRAGLDITRGHRWMVFLTWVMLSLAVAAGLIACCVGYFVTLLLLPVGLVLMYRDLRGLRGTAGG